MTVSSNSIPLCVDLDGTLIQTDLLLEALVRVAKQNPLGLPALFSTLFAGKAAFKDKISKSITIEARHLPFRDEVIALVEAARANGQKTVLCTASPAPFAHAVADQLDLFDDVLTSTADVNLASGAKAAALTERFGERGFDYIGNSEHDLAVFAQSRRGTLVSSRSNLRERSLKHNPDMEFLDDPHPTLRTWLTAIRWHQWVKNLLIFVPIIAAHAIGDIERFASAFVAFVAFCLCASATYIANDLLDLDSDRAHHSKKFRPFAAGSIPIASGMLVSALLLSLSFVIGAFLPWRFELVLAGYLVVTVAYSVVLKRQVVVDVMLLAGLYTLRIIAGAAATEITPSFWLLAFSMFTFLSLAMVKRVSELKRTSGSGKISGRGYVQDDIIILLSLGSASGLVSVLILALYMQSEIISLMYSAKGWLWLIPALVLYWMTRLWIKTNRNEIDDDPVVFAAKDWQSLVVLALIGTLFLLAVNGPTLW